jgi:dUTP pyrophosphatase
MQSSKRSNNNDAAAAASGASSPKRMNIDNFTETFLELPVDTYFDRKQRVLKFKKIIETAFAPQIATFGSAGYDLITPIDVCLKPQEWRVVDIGIAIELPHRTYGRIAERSGLATKHGIGIQAGVIDNDYRGSVGVCLINRSQVEYNFKRGDKIAQMIIERYYTPELQEVSELGDTDRGSGGFGSTGK